MDSAKHPADHPALGRAYHVLPESEWEFFYSALRDKTGLDLSQYKPEQLRRRIATMVHGRAMTSLRPFWNQLDSDPYELQAFLDKLAINVTELFRDPEKWAELQESVLPELTKRGRGLRCWSAGCATGAEAYSLAVLLDSEFAGPHQVLGTDIDFACLAQANQGVFSAGEMRHVPEALRERYFHPFQEGWRADVRLRKYLRFRRHDLLADPIDGTFDLILCRNVLIYLTDEARVELSHRLFDALAPGGVLFVGNTERIFNARDVGYESPLPFFYRKPGPEEPAWRLAS